MRISTDQGKFWVGCKLWLLFAIVATIVACLILTVFRIQSPASRIIQTSSIKVGSVTPKSKISNPKSQTSGRSVARTTDKAEDRGRDEEIEREREEMEHKRYDQPGEAAKYLIQRRLPEGENEIRPELYLQALEKSRDLPQFSTLLNRLLPSQRSSFGLANPQESILQGLQGWTGLGPGNVGGRTRALLINPRTPDIMYAAAVSGGVWKTTDGGRGERSWQPLTDLLPTLAVSALAFDPVNPEIIYAGTGEGYFNADATRGAGIFRSFDGGNTWRRLDGTGTPDFYYVNDIVVSPNNSSRIYAATRKGVMRSVDGGSTWTAVVNEQNFGGCSDLAIRTDRTTDVVFAACGLTTNFKAPASSPPASIYRNENAASGFGNWEVVYTEAGMARTSLAIAPSNQNVVYAVSSESGAGGGTPHTLHAVFRSTGGGEAGSWVKVNDGSSSKLNAALFTNAFFAFQNECNGGFNQTYAQGWFSNVIAVDPLNENSVWVGGVDLFRSDDGGVNWGMASFWQEPKNSLRYVHADHHAIVFHPQFNGNTNRTMIVGTDGGIFQTENSRAQTATGNRAPCSPETNKVAWTSLNNGYAVTQFYHGAAFPYGASYLGGAQDNGVVMGSDAEGVNGWREILDGDGGYVAVDPASPNIVYAESTGLSLMKSTEWGANFHQATTNINDEGFGFIVPFVMDPSDRNRLWLGGIRLWRTKNGADSWAPASARLNGMTTAVAVAQGDGNFVLAGTDQGNIHRTTNGLSATDSAIWPDIKPRTGTVSSLAFDPTNRDIAYATYSNFGNKHVWRSVNGGANWLPIDGNGASALPDIPVNCIIVDPTNPQRLYVGTDIGVYTSPDGGVTWAVENTGFANVPVEWLSVSSFGGVTHLFAFTRGRGAWRVPLTQVCNYKLSPASQTLDAMGGSGAVTVTASGGDCTWTAESNTSWITIHSETSARGSGTVNYTVAPNREPNLRTGTLIIAGQPFTVTQAGLAVSVSAASLVTGMLAPESIVTAFGAGMAVSTQTASGNQLPINLAGTILKVRDQAGNERPSPLFFVSPSQINYLIPAGTVAGPASVTIFKGNDKLFNCQINVSKVAPGFFTVDGSGRGIPAGQALRYKTSTPNSTPQSEPLFFIDAGQRIISRPIDLGPDLGANSDQVFLVLYGTGFRLRTSVDTVTARIGNIVLPVLFAGAQGDFAGLDQVNIQIPRSLAGSGEVNLMLTVDGQQSNVVRISIK